jgi:N-acetylmuramoyl-L-alanine amidase
MATPLPPRPSPRPSPRPQNPVSTGRILQTTFSVAILLATLFTAFSPNIFSIDLSEKFRVLLTPEPEEFNPAAPTSQRLVHIGIVAGHWGNDSGAVCANGTTEAQVNLAIATLVQQKLTAQGLQADILQEFDPRLQDYKAAVLVSIHNDSCDYINEQATGFKVAAAVGARDPNLANRLVACLRDRYQRATGLPFHSGSITADMREYHAFDEVDPATTSAIIETGFLNLDYILLTQNTGVVADGVTAGILCYINNENIAPTPLPTP